MYFYYIGMVAGVGAALATTTCIAGQVRGVDDIFNHFLGGISMGMVVGAKGFNLVY